MSIRQWLGSTYKGLISQSRDIGYQSIHYANGVYVAVGNQKGYPPFVERPTLSGQVPPCAGCSWSADGVNWTDAVLPFADYFYSYTAVAGLPNGRWVAAALWTKSLTETYARIAVSTDNAKTWATEAAGSPSNNYGGTIRSIAVGNNRIFLTGQNNANVVWVHPTATGFLSNGTTRVIDSPGFVASAYGGNDYFMFTTPQRVETFNAGAWTTYKPVAYGNDTNLPANWRDPRSLLIARSGVLGTAAAPTAWALVGIDSPFVSAITRDIWSSASPNLGQTWVKRATLPAITATTDYWELAYNDRVLAAIGDGILVVTKDGTNWTRIDIPAGRWRGVASDGNDFVCVSQSGDRMKISGAGIDGRIG